MNREGAADPAAAKRARGSLGVAAKLYLGLGAAFALTLAASLVGGYSFLNVGETQRRIAEETVPELNTAFLVAQQTALLVVAASRLIAVDTNEELAAARTEFGRQRTVFQELVDSLPQGEDAGETVGEVRRLAADLIANVERLDRSVERRLEFARAGNALGDHIEAVRLEIDAILVPEIDDQTLFLATGYRELGLPPAPPGAHNSYEELSRYRNLLTLSNQSARAAVLLGQVLKTPDSTLIRPIRERFEAVERAIGRARGNVDGWELKENLDRLVAAGRGPSSAFRLRESELGLIARQQEYLARNRDLEEQLVEAAETGVATARADARTAAADSQAAIRLGLTLLILLNVVAVAAVALIGWLLVGRSLVRRITHLAASMRRMAGGDLETSVDVGGRDEVTDMANALEVFRQHALEVQRLNLVEKLAEEVQAKNVELEKVLDDLRHAQDQIVLQEKLAALGQLTAGVAHEIKNPLNFIKNFSETSRELAGELKELLEESGEGIDEKARGEIEEVAADLDTSLSKIAEHSLRADGIVRSMLSHSRESSGEMEPVDVNTLLIQFANLAYHSRRALDSDFNVTLNEELDRELEPIQAVPQEMSQVFLNLVTNACQATDDRRKTEGAGYTPAIWLKTERSGGTVEVRVRDNGPGMPESVRMKVFEPFFTTKPTNEGTGLGLSISSDIVRRHGGELTVETREGEFTEFIVRLPVDGGVGSGAGAEAGAAQAAAAPSSPAAAPTAGDGAESPA